MKVKQWGTLALLLEAGSLQSLSAHDVKPGEPIRNYVTHAEIDEAVKMAIDQRQVKKAHAQQEQVEKQREELRRERFFNRSSRER